MTYEVVKTIGVHNTPKNKREAFLVKTEPTICRKRGSFELFEIDHVIVEAMRLVDDGVVYEETHVVASDATGTAHDSILFQASRALTVEEAMFSIGKVLAPEVEYEAVSEAPADAEQDAEPNTVDSDTIDEVEDDTNGN